MDEIEKLMNAQRAEISDLTSQEMNDLLEGTHGRILRRRRTRQVLGALPVMAALLLVLMNVAPLGNPELELTGEVFLAGWEHEMSVTIPVEMDEAQEDQLYEEALEYILDHEYALLESEGILEVSELIDLETFLKEV